MKDEDQKPKSSLKPTETRDQKTTPAEEWGEGFETGRAIARSGDSKGKVPGATSDDSTDDKSGNT